MMYVFSEETFYWPKPVCSIYGTFHFVYLIHYSGHDGNMNNLLFVLFVL